METASLSPLEGVAHLTTDTQVIARLSEIARAHGELESVTPLYPPDAAQRLYLITFRDNPSATHAAQALDCQLYGYTTVLVWLPQAG